MNTLKRIEKEAEESKFFDFIHTFTEKDIADYMKHHEAFVNANKRGYGYWIWKPYCISRVFNKINEGDILVYLDAGSSINADGYKTFQDYVTACRNSEHKNVSFQYNQNIEEDWTKNDIFEEIGTTEQDKKSGQIWAGLWILEKSPTTKHLVDKWLEKMQNYHLIDDSPSKTPNVPSFRENRHDQSIFSCILKKYGTHTMVNKLDLDGGLDKYKDTAKDLPFWATRLKY